MKGVIAAFTLMHSHGFSKEISINLSCVDL